MGEDPLCLLLSLAPTVRQFFAVAGLTTHQRVFQDGFCHSEKYNFPAATILLCATLF